MHQLKGFSTRVIRARGIAAVAVLAIITLAGCGGGGSGSDPTPLPTAPYSQTDLKVGTGKEAATGNSVTVNYSLWIYDPKGQDSKGQFIQSSVGSTPFTFTVGNGSVIAGWDRGVPGMKVGGTRRLIVPPELAYGAAGNGPIPGNATLVFDIDLLDVK